MKFLHYWSVSHVRSHVLQFSSTAVEGVFLKILLFCCLPLARQRLFFTLSSGESLTFVLKQKRLLNLSCMEQSEQRQNEDNFVKENRGIGEPSTASIKTCLKKQSNLENC